MTLLITGPARSRKILVPTSRISAQTPEIYGQFVGRTRTNCLANPVDEPGNHALKCCWRDQMLSGDRSVQRRSHPCRDGIDRQPLRAPIVVIDAIALIVALDEARLDELGHRAADRRHP